MKKELTGSRYAGSSAPMSLQSYAGFAERDHTAQYPFKATPAVRNVFKLILNSNSAVVNNNTYTFNNVNLSDVKGGTLRCGITSLISSGNIVGTTVYNVHMNPLIQMRSFDTRTRGITDAIFNGRAGIDYVFPVGGNDCNIEIDADAIRRTNSLTVYFTDLNGVRILATNVWQLTLWFYEP